MASSEIGTPHQPLKFVEHFIQIRIKLNVYLNMIFHHTINNVIIHITKVELLMRAFRIQITKITILRSISALDFTKGGLNVTLLFLFFVYDDRVPISPVIKV